ncbi:hypothetical protein EWM64_g10959 [Hericium alpestre]|uniref:Proteasome maturation factor UMP1 n=1 Tax=Hericium alpestre TaxID=135208 RepID=A0A4Y9ZGU9_9AGAM|nr:hypothetical protein EWM64_g10959 [Hericium alpestre]
MALAEQVSSHRRAFPHLFVVPFIMEPSYKIIPADSAKTVSVKDTANSFGLHDTLQYGPRSLGAEISSTSRLRNRLEKWDETQDNFKLTMLNDTMGLAMPMKLLMERKIVSQIQHLPGFHRSNVHLDILMGRDEQIDVTDFMGTVDMDGGNTGVHTEMEKKLRMR